jgi:hypothetical protein
MLITRITRCEPRNYPKCLSIPFISIDHACTTHKLIQLVFGNMPKWGMAEIMRESCRFCGIWINSARRLDNFGLFADTFLSDASCYLPDLQRVCESVVKDITVFRRHNLSDLCKAGKRSGVKYAVPITLKVRASVGFALNKETTFRILRARSCSISTLCQALSSVPARS